MNWYLKVIKQYADFSGRARRTEYWMFTLISGIVGGVIQAVEHLLEFTFYEVGLISSVYDLFVIIPGLAVTVRRFHDVNKSGWNWLWVLLPIIGWIYLFVLTVRNGDEGINQYGADPKNPASELDDIGVVQS